MSDPAKPGPAKHGPVGVGLVGCGSISATYLRNAPGFDSFRILAVADLDQDRARRAAKEHGIPTAGTLAEMLADPAIEVILNLTTPDAHADIAIAALSAGRAVYNEKPLAIRRRDARRILTLAAERGLPVGCAPDTFLGAGLSTCRGLIDAGAIGTPVAACAFMMCPGHEGWHPDPGYYYKRGAGPLFDMGPYYLTALVHLLGPVARVTGSARASFPTRTITSEPRRGQTITVETPTHIAGVLEMESGPIVTLVTSFDVCHHSMPPIEVYGPDGSMQVPDPNGFGGPVRVKLRNDTDWHEVPLAKGRADNARGLGLHDLCYCLRAGSPPTSLAASGALAYHVLDVMHSILDAAQTGERVKVDSKP